MICSNLEVHTVGATKSVDYRWYPAAPRIMHAPPQTALCTLRSRPAVHCMCCRYWALGDLFHITVGVLFSFTLLATYALTTRYANRVVDVALQRCDELHVSMDRRAVLASGLQSIISGVNVAGVRRALIASHTHARTHTRTAPLSLTSLLSSSQHHRRVLCDVLLGDAPHTLVQPLVGGRGALSAD